MLGQVVQIVMSFRIICANSVALTAVISRAVRDINKKTISIVSFDKFAMLINFLFCVIWFPSVAQWTARGKDQNSDGLCRFKNGWTIEWVGDWLH